MSILVGIIACMGFVLSVEVVIDYLTNVLS